MKHVFLFTAIPFLILTIACNKKENEQIEPKEKKPNSVQKKKTQETTTPKIAISSSPDSLYSDSLWAIAPANTGFGLVVAPSGLQSVHNTGLEIIRTLELIPGGKELMDSLRRKIENKDIDFFDTKALLAAGVDLELGAAYFNAGDDSHFAVLPIRNRTAFLRATGGSTQTIDSMEVDKHSNDLFCTQKDQRYLCTANTDDLKLFGPIVNGPLSKKTASLSADKRGSWEIVGDVQLMQDTGVINQLNPQFTEYFTHFRGLWSIALQKQPGSAQIRAWFGASGAKGLMKQALNAKSTLTQTATSMAPTGIFSLHLPIEIVLAGIEDTTLPTGHTLKEIIRYFTGELLAYTPNSKKAWGRIEIGHKNAEPLKTLLNMVCGLANGVGFGIKATPSDGRCQLLVDVSKLPLPNQKVARLFSKPVPFVVEILQDRLRIQAGETQELSKSNPESNFGKKLMEESWNFGLWSNKISLFSHWETIQQSLPSKIAAWMIGHLYEFGIAGGLRDDGVHLSIQLSTYAADGDASYHAYQNSLLNILSGSDAKKELLTLSKNWNGTRAGRAGEKGTGYLLVIASIGAFASLALPYYYEVPKQIEENNEAPVIREGKTL